MGRERDLMDVVAEWLVTTAFPRQCHGGDPRRLRDLEFGLQHERVEEQR